MRLAPTSWGIGVTPSRASGEGTEVSVAMCAPESPEADECLMLEYVSAKTWVFDISELFYTK